MEKSKKKYLIISAILLVSVAIALGQYLGAFNAMYALATNPGHSWNQMECSTTFCVDTTNNKIGIGTASPSETFHVVGGIKIGENTTCNSSTGAWNFTNPVSVIEPTEENHAVSKKYVDSLSSAIANCGLSFSDPRDGNVYSIVKIGDQCWMQENLKYLPSVDDNTGFATAGETTAGYGVYGYDGKDVATAKAAANYSTYGVLYNWAAANAACPTGWHLPTHDEWTTLERAVCISGTCVADFPYDTSTTDWRGTEEGSKLKAISPDWNGTNTSGFTALPSGYRYPGGSFGNLSSDAYFWSSSASGSYAWSRRLGSGSTTVDRYSYSKVYGFSVRCIKE
jgi:uncharacterized protein (TIGR02145 family)